MKWLGIIFLVFFIVGCEKRDGPKEVIVIHKSEPDFTSKEYKNPKAELKDIKIPDNANRYKKDLMRAVNAAWGIKGSPALAAAQIHKESTWNPNAKSSYAGGLAQFTSPTRKDMERWYPDLLAGFDEFNPKQALIAQSLYNKRLWDRIVKKGTVDDCNAMAFVLAMYNGGAGWINGYSKGKDKPREPGDRKLAEQAGDNPDIWWNSVEKYSNRNEKSIKENRDYPKKVILELQLAYEQAGFFGPVYCND